MVEEILARLNVSPGQVICDGTIGGAGHASELIRRLNGTGVFVGLDRDPDMIGRARRRLEGVAADHESGREELRLILKAARYGELPEVLAGEGLEGADAVLLDIGINSIQVDDPARGFSFSRDGPLDGRYNPAEPGTRSVADLVNIEEERTLARWIRDYSDERFAGRIARRIVERRVKRAFETTTEFAGVIVDCYPANKRHKKPHPATRTFQALRIVANNELHHVEQGIRSCIETLNPGGTLCVISYHSGEDRITKRLFDEYGSPKTDPTNAYSATTFEGIDYRVESRGAKKPTAGEVESNPRARSARLRTIRRVEASA